MDEHSHIIDSVHQTKKNDTMYDGYRTLLSLYRFYILQQEEIL